ncbi:Hypothetical protein Y17_1016 [Pectobacterium wasabiae CFBP 3304]|nr:Hypothetical protein Y17_1016 [Pectobacterium wasabiae CFBP 3304]
MRDILSLTGGQPLAGQIRSRRICRAVAAFLKLELFRVWLSNLERFLILPDNKRMNMGLSPDKP